MIIKTFDTLYARDSKGTILQWNIEVSGGTDISIRMSYGEYNGAQALKWQRNIKGKNIGKSNETTPYNQAIADAESKIRLRKKKGYMTLEEVQKLEITTDGIKFRKLIQMEDKVLQTLATLLPKYRTDASGHIKPMKAQQYYRSKKNWTDNYGIIWDDRKYFYLTNPYVNKESNAIITKFPCMAQPKINGVRVTVQLVDNKPVLKSKEGKIYTVAHINDFLTINSDIFKEGEHTVVLDGELYIHGELLQDIGSAINKPNLNTPRIVLILFDIAIEDNTNLERWNYIKDAIQPKLDIHLNCPIQVIQTVKINNDADAQKFTDICIGRGYEGAIFRQFKGEYKFGGRPQDMTKLKRTLSDEFNIINIVPQEKDDTKGNFICITKEGLQFAVNPKGSDTFKRKVLYQRDKFIGKSLTCDFYEWTKDKKPFHILNNTVRDYE